MDSLTPTALSRQAREGGGKSEGEGWKKERRGSRGRKFIGVGVGLGLASMGVVVLCDSKNSTNCKSLTYIKNAPSNTVYSF